MKSTVERFFNWKCGIKLNLLIGIQPQTRTYWSQLDETNAMPFGAMVIDVTRFSWAFRAPRNIYMIRSSFGGKWNYIYQCMWSSMYPMYERNCHLNRRIGTYHSMRGLRNEKTNTLLVESSKMEMNWPTARCEATVWIRWIVIGDLLVGSNVKQTGWLVFRCCSKRLATWMILRMIEMSKWVFEI